MIRWEGMIHVNIHGYNSCRYIVACHLRYGFEFTMVQGHVEGFRRCLPTTCNFFVCPVFGQWVRWFRWRPQLPGMWQYGCHKVCNTVYAYHKWYGEIQDPSYGLLVCPPFTNHYHGKRCTTILMRKYWDHPNVIDLISVLRTLATNTSNA